LIMFRLQMCCLMNDIPENWVFSIAYFNGHNGNAYRTTQAYCGCDGTNNGPRSRTDDQR
jgi:hypothetical protein